MKHGKRIPKRVGALMWLFCGLLSTSPHPTFAAESHVDMSSIAREYVGLVLELGEHDPGYVDTYYGPGEWLDQAKSRKRAGMW